MFHVIGDIHGKFNAYTKLISTMSTSIQLGDFGIGFTDIPEIPAQHTFLRGNHDNPFLCQQNPNWIKDGTILFDGRVMVIGGADSIDVDYRVAGVDWWAEEQLSYQELNALIDLYEQVKPDVMLTHDAPFSIVSNMYPMVKTSSRTNQAFDTMRNIHQPKQWLFGHHHRTMTTFADGTLYKCLGELDSTVVDLNNLSE